MNSRYEAVVCGGSAGGIQSLRSILENLPSSYSIPILVVIHFGKRPLNTKPFSFFHKKGLNVNEASDKDTIVPGNVYFAPPDYHMLIEEDRSISLSSDEKVCFSRPSIDVLFECAADVYGDKLIGIILSGANSDGSLGLRRIKESGGLAIVEDPNLAEFKEMPSSAITCLQSVAKKNIKEIHKSYCVDHIIPAIKIAEVLAQLQEENFNE